jgi:EAL domain-containing protein (putative c-di-GMP-specific phosphodiesterase class I)/GGDEF domain-containing protein
MLAVALSTLLSFMGSAVVSLFSSRHYLEQQLILKNEDNASALALLISQQGKDSVTIELYVASVFDSGHYELILVTDPKGKTIVERKSPPDTGDAPVWFTRLLPISPTPGHAQISDGWKQYGTIEVRSQSKFAYGELWHGAASMAGWLLLAGIISGWIAALILKRMREPLARVVDQARAICERRFSTIEEPKVPELKQLAFAMNTMVARLKTMFEEEAARLEAVRREVNYDSISGFANRMFFFSQFSELLKSDEQANTGSLLLLRIIDLAAINQRLGRLDTDKFLKIFSKSIETSVSSHSGHLVGRLNGVDFAVALPGLEDAETLANELFERIAKDLSHLSDGAAVVRIGFSDYQQGMQPGPLMGLLDSALAEIESSGENKPRRAQASGSSQQRTTTAQWSDQLGHAIKNGWLRLVGMPVVGFGDKKLLHQECPLRLRFLEEGEWQTAGKFLPMATRLQMTAELDIAATRLAINQLASDPKSPDLAVNLSGESLQSDIFRKQMRELMQGNTALCRRLWMEVSETSAFANLDAFRAFRKDMMGFDCHIGIEHFGREFSRIGTLHDLGLHYLKVDGSFINDIDTQSGNQAFLEGLCQIAHNIGLLVIAEGVKRPEELSTLPKLGFDGATGPAIPRD